MKRQVAWPDMLHTSRIVNVTQAGCFRGVSWLLQAAENGSLEKILAEKSQKAGIQQFVAGKVWVLKCFDASVIQGKHCNTMTRSSQKFDLDYGIGHDCIVYWMLRYFSSHLVLKCIGNENGWLWESPCRRVEHLSFFVFDVSIICYPWRVDHACFFSCPFWPNMEISKVKLFSDSRPARKHLLGRRRRHCLFFHNLKQLTVSKVGDLIAIKRCEEFLPPSFWPMCLTVAVSRRLSKSRLPLRKMKLPHPRWVMLLYWVFGCF